MDFRVLQLSRTYRLCIDHVQGDPFATPSRVRIVYRNRGNINSQYFEEKHRRIAVEDYLLRRLHQNLKGDKNMKHLNNKTEYRQPRFRSVPDVAVLSAQPVRLFAKCRRLPRGFFWNTSLPKLRIVIHE